MESVPSQPMPPPPPPAAAGSASSEAAETTREKDTLHRTKAVQFLGRTTPIILQNDNGPCPLLSICNILSLRNSLNLSPDIPEVSQEKLLSLVAERLIDSNSNIEGKDSGYVENQQQNISDAIDLLPRLTTGIDVNIKFTRIDDFEFTRECTIFDLLDIPLYHGWIVDPQDHETAEAIGSKSYNTLMGELVSLDAQIIDNEKKVPEDDDVDFVAATTKALGVPSPCLSRGHSFEGSPHRARRGDVEEEAELLRVLKLSEEKLNSSPDGVIAHGSTDETAFINKPNLMEHSVAEKGGTDETVKIATLISDDSYDMDNNHVNPNFSPVTSREAVSPISKGSEEDSRIQFTCEEPKKHDGDGSHTDLAAVNVILKPECIGQDPQSASEDSHDNLRSTETTPNGPNATSLADEMSNHKNACGERDSSSLVNAAAADSDSSCSRMHHIDETEAFSSSVDDSEPIYEGEECILDSSSAVYENGEPVYEGEVLLAEQADRDRVDDISMNSKGTISIRQGELIRNFLKHSASQLTVYGLFSLQEKVKERELCVFFRNNHFNTMFKYEGELYILVTDQGYMNQLDLVWEKLNEVNGDTQYINGNFKEFKMDDNSNSTWNEQNAVASTADYLASIDKAADCHSNFNSDLQLAIALQQQEFEQQQQEQQQPRRDVQQQQQAITASSGLVTGPQVPRSSGRHPSSSSRQDTKAKEKCIIM